MECVTTILHPSIHVYKSSYFSSYANQFRGSLYAQLTTVNTIFITAYTAVGWLGCLRCQQQFRGSQTHSRFEDIRWTAKESSFLPTASQLATCDLIFYIGIVNPSPLVIGIFLGIISHFLIYMSLELSFVIYRMSCWACGDSTGFCTQLLYK